jgi:hypothetical protein
MLQSSKGETMNQEEFEALMDKLDVIYERVANERRAIGFMADHIKDNQAMSYLGVMAYGMRMTENMLLEVLGRPVDMKGMDVPY